MNLYIVSLKKFFIKNGRVHTYGGFGDYVKMFLDDFDEIHICVPLYPEEIEGGYIIESPKIHYHFLPNYKNELFLMLKSPIILAYLFFYLRKADVINPRIPDMTGVYGWLVGRFYKKPMFISVQSDITLLLENKNSTKLKGIMRVGLFTWLKLYVFFEKIIMKHSLAFPQGARLVEKYSGKNSKAIPWVSSALYDDDIILRKVSFGLQEKERITLLSVGRLTRQKNQITLLESLSILHRNGHTNVYLKIVGKKDEKIFKELNYAIEKLNISRYVELIAPVNHGETLWDIFDNADIFLLSSIWEGTPKVLLEALARSLPVVATDVGGVPTVIKDNFNGFLCNHSDSASFSENIEKIIRMDKEELNKMIVNGHHEVVKYTVAAQRKILIDSLYKYGILQE